MIDNRIILYGICGKQIFGKNHKFLDFYKYGQLL